MRRDLLASTLDWREVLFPPGENYSFRWIAGVFYSQSLSGGLTGNS
jgi:hypothetical protein